MKKIVIIKFWIGIILISFALLGGIIFYLESFNILDSVLSTYDTSNIWERGSNGNGSSNTPIFLGLCAVAGALLLMNIKKEEKEKVIEL